MSGVDETCYDILGTDSDESGDSYRIVGVERKEANNDDATKEGAIDDGS